MAGAPPESLELLIAAIASIADPDFELYGVNATTAPVSPAFVINGPIRRSLDLPCEYGCLGGVATPASAMGRALPLPIRHVAGHAPGLRSLPTFGSTAGVTGF